MGTLDQRYEPIEVDDDDDLSTNSTDNLPFVEIAEARFAWRVVLRGFVAAAAAGAPSSFTFKALEQVIKEDHQVAEGYDASVLIRWGDKVLADAPIFDANNQSAASQAKQFGYNCDFLAYLGDVRNPVASMSRRPSIRYALNRLIGLVKRQQIPVVHRRYLLA